MLSAASKFLKQTSSIIVVSIFLILNTIPVCSNAGSTIVNQNSLSGSLVRFLHGTTDPSGLRRTCKSRVFGLSLAGTVGSNPAENMDVCLM
jgi:hypothetical protein